MITPTETTFEHLGPLKAEIVELVKNSKPGYEADTIKACLILKLIDAGTPIEEIPIPTNWRERLLALCIHTDLPVSQCVREAGVSLSFVRLHCKRHEDFELLKVVNESRIANFERRIDEPTKDDLRSPSIPLRGLDSLAGWDTKLEDRKNAAQHEVSRAIEERRKLVLTINQKDQIETLQLETFRSEATLTGVLGLEDMELDEDD